MAMSRPSELAAPRRADFAPLNLAPENFGPEKSAPAKTGSVSLETEPAALVSTGTEKRCALLRKSLVERLDLHQAGVVIAADPEGHRGGRIVDEHRAHIGVLRHQVFDRLAGLRVESHPAICRHSAGPEFTVLVED